MDVFISPDACGSSMNFIYCTVCIAPTKIKRKSHSRGVGQTIQFNQTSHGHFWQRSYKTSQKSTREWDVFFIVFQTSWDSSNFKRFSNHFNQKGFCVVAPVRRNAFERLPMHIIFLLYAAEAFGRRGPAGEALVYQGLCSHHRTGTWWNIGHVDYGYWKKHVCLSSISFAGES